MINPRSRIDYPLLLSPIALEKVWGGTALAKRFPTISRTDSNVGEVWVVWEGLAVKNGDLAGKTLRELFVESPTELVGPVELGSRGGGFPLLVKFLDARENLSVQVHPDDEYARAREGQPYGKCEMWYVLEAAEGAAVIHGLRSDLPIDGVAGALTGPSILDVVARVEVSPGDVLINTPGVIHALGEGVVIFELQQSSDLTYRLYDWDRGAVGGARRELHLDKGAEVADRRAIRQHKITPVTLEAAPVRRALLSACRYFAAELLDLPDHASLTLRGSQLHVLTVLDGSIKVRSTEPESGWSDLGPGDTGLLPAAMTSSEVASHGPARVIRSFIPDLPADVIDPLRALGISDDQIAQLGGEHDRSDLWKLLRAL